MIQWKNEIPKITLILLSFIIGLLLAIQLKNNSSNNTESISSVASHLQTELTNIRERKLKTEKEIKEIEEKIKLLRDSKVKADEYYDNIKKEIDKYNLQLGIKKAKGEGIIVDFSNNTDEKKQELIINFDLILSVINKLNSAGAEGLAINEERIIYITDFRYEQGQLLVNGNPISENIKIYAVGNKDTMEATLNMKYGILWEMKNNFGINSKIDKYDEVNLPMYTKEIKFDFAKVSE